MIIHLPDLALVLLLSLPPDELHISSTLLQHGLGEVE